MRSCAGDNGTGRIAATRGARRSTRDDEIDGFRALALLVGLDVEGDALSLVQRLEPGALDGGDVHEDIAPAVVRFDEAVAAFGVEELDDTCHGHRETPFPVVCSAAGPHGATAQPDIHKRGKQRPKMASVTPPAPTGGGTSKPAR